MTDAQSDWPTEAATTPNVPVPGGCEEAVYGVTPYQPCNKRAEVLIGFDGHEGSWRYCRQCADNRTGAIILGDYSSPEYVAPTRYFYHPESSSLMTTRDGSHAGEGGDGLVEEIDAARYSEIEAQICGATEAPAWGVATTEAEHVPVAETPEAFKRRLTEEVQTWTEAKEKLTEAKDKEMSARLTLTSTCFPTPKKGTQRYALDGGYNVKLAFGWNYSLGIKGKVSEQGTEVSIYDQVVELEGQINALGPEGSLLVERLIKWKPELSATEYEKLARNEASEVEVQAKALIDEILTVSPKSPTLDLEEPKPKS